MIGQHDGQANSLSDAIVAVDATTGAIKWSYQTTAHDVWTPAVPLGRGKLYVWSNNAWTDHLNGKPAQDYPLNIKALGNTLFFGTTVPKLFGGMGPSGVYAFSLGGKVSGS